MKCQILKLLNYLKMIKQTKKLIKGVVFVKTDRGVKLVKVKKPAKYWLVNTSGRVCEVPVKGRKSPWRKKFGNYFKTKKMAEIRMIKLFKRIKNI